MANDAVTESGSLLPLSSRQRRGILLIAVLICLFAVMGVAGTTVRLMMMQQRQTRTLHHQTQATWLADSALQRAIWRLARDPNFSGEAWNLPKKALGQTSAAVTIEVVTTA